MNSIQKVNAAAAAVAGRRSKPATKPAGATVMLLFQHKLLRGSYTIADGLLIVSCGSVSTSVELKPGHPEAQARRALFKLASAGELTRPAVIREH